METTAIIEQEVLNLEPEWQKEYARLGNFYAKWAAFLIIFTFPLGILLYLDFLNKDNWLQLWAIQLLPSVLIAIALIIRRLRDFPHEYLVLIMAFGIFASAAHKVAEQDFVFYLLNNSICLIFSAVLMVVKPVFPPIIVIYILIINLIAQKYIYQNDLSDYFARQGGMVLVVGGMVFVMVTWFRYQILRNNFLNSLALQQSYQKLAQQNQIIEQNSRVIQEINQDLTASINYAKRIQEAILPLDERISQALPEYFILWKPRDIVSGDFYWFMDSPLIIAAVDCTGHGVPGALMSMLGSEALGHLVNERDIKEADEILNNLNHEIRRLLKQTETGNQDGMDMALCVIDKVKQEMQYAGAKNPLVYIQNDEMKVIKAENFPIGGFHKSHEGEEKFTKHCIDISIPTTFYLFSDGYQDQFGGPKGKKFMVTQFHKLLYEIHQKPMPEQKQILEQTIQDWMQMSKQRQIDDILVIGVRV
ncbi:MAG: SpoIIE family protein phosphatase [Microscillaceae bacterium]|nr:SpoIIE family protein phosphatase [Microscillaceae bacterium]